MAINHFTLCVCACAIYFLITLAIWFLFFVTNTHLIIFENNQITNHINENKGIYSQIHLVFQLSEIFNLIEKYLFKLHV